LVLEVSAASRPGADLRWGTLADLLSDINSVSEELTICVHLEGRVGLETIVTLVDDEEGDPPSGLRYLLEVSLTTEVLDVWSSWRDGRIPSLAEACEAVVHYACHDAYLPTE
jgi:hypothetical protein